MSFIGKIISSIIFVNMIFVIFITGNILRNEKKEQLSNLHEKIEQDKKILQKINSVALYDLDIGTLTTNLETFFNNKDIVKIEIKDKYGIHINFEDKIYNKNETIKSLIDLKYNNNLLGKLTLIYSKTKINNHFKAFKADIINFTILLTLFLSLIIFFLIKQFTKPILALSHATDKIAKGDLDYEINIKTNDEIGKLANKFKHMQEALKDKINSLSLKNDELNETKLHFQNLIENNIAAIVIKTSKYNVSMANKKARELFGLTINQLEGVEQLPTSWKILNSNAKEIGLNQLPSNRVFRTKNNMFNEIIGILHSKDEEIIWILVNAYAEFDENGEIQRVISTSIDISEIKKAETKINNLNIELEFRVKNRTKELTKSKKELQSTISTLQLAQEQLVQNEKMASLGNLVAGVAHEINTPVGTGLTGITHLVSETLHLEKLYKKQNMSQSEFEEYLETIKEIGKSVTISLNQAAKLISSFKQVAVDQSHSEIREFYLKTYIEEILLSIKTKIKQTKVSVVVNCEESIKINSYPGAFSQVITNLVLNSLLHGFDKDDIGSINIDIQDDKDEIKITYKDDGKGISEKNLPKIYEPFFTTKRAQGGSGLGMHIIYNIIISNLYGRISCESKEGFGVTFIIYVKKDLI